ncbi:LmeA family phospholipid-binding protein [Nocardia callitridis]|uniref:DUF2993 domain-containing protein n=1 Tax=Nocardia callitridis TaxID=648753 RepID=A0ABP9K145_9NOCA
MSTEARSPRTIQRRTLVIALVVIVLLLATVLVGGEVYARHKLSRCVSTQFEQEIGSKIDVGFGAKPMLITLLDNKIGKLTVDSDDTKFGPAVDMKVHAVFNDIELQSGGAGGGTIGSSSADIDWSDDGIKQTLGGLVSGVHSSSGSDSLSLDVLGGLAQLQVKPVVTNGAVKVETQSAQLLGMGLPNDLVQGIVDTFSESLQTYPLGLRPTEAEVTDSGIAVKLTGGPSELQPAQPGQNTEIRC